MKNKFTHEENYIRMKKKKIRKKGKSSRFEEKELLRKGSYTVKKTEILIN